MKRFSLFGATALAMFSVAEADVTFKIAFDPVWQTEQQAKEQGAISHYKVFLCESPIPDNDGYKESDDNPVTCDNELTTIDSGTTKPDLSGYLVDQEVVPGEVCESDIIIKKEAEDFDPGQDGMTFFDTSPRPGWPPESYREDEHDVDIHHSPLPDGPGFVTGSNVPGEWTRFTIQAPKEGDYIGHIRMSNANEGVSRVSLLHLGTDQEVVFSKGITSPNVTWEDFQIIESDPSHLFLVEGRQFVRLQIIESESDIDWFTLSMPGDNVDCNPVPPVVMPVTYRTERTDGLIYIRSASATENSRSPLSNMASYNLNELVRRPKAPENLRRQR